MDNNPSRRDRGSSHRHRVRSSNAGSARRLLLGTQRPQLLPTGARTTASTIQDIESVEDARLTLQLARAQRDAHALEMACAEAKLQECMLETSLRLRAASSARDELVHAELHVGRVRAAVRRSGLNAHVGAPLNPLQRLLIRTRMCEVIDDFHQEAVAPDPDDVSDSDDDTTASSVIDATDLELLASEVDVQSKTGSIRSEVGQSQRAQSVELCPRRRHRPPEDCPYLIRDDNGRLIPGLG
ncbi:hypothetical protein DENSPDRAFT_886937 [Dentipellis sp. KUC8613]|nr:hypothetical protein DENSPDRAFT_886937 [Dentipellis sp. KUC8613]